MNTILVSPTSRMFSPSPFSTPRLTSIAGGTVTLASPSPFSPPAIDPSFFSTPFDIAAMRYALRSASRFAAAPPWRGFIVGQGGAFARVNVSSDATLDAWAREQATTV